MTYGSTIGEKFYEDGSVRRELFDDGIHPNEEGHRIMADVLIKEIKAMFSL